MVIIASILILLVLAGILVGSVNNGAFRGHDYRQAKYLGIIKPGAQRLAAIKHKIREEAVVETITQHWSSRIKRHESRQARDTVRIASKIQRGKDPRRLIQRSDQRDRSPNNPVKLRDRELKFITGMRQAARDGNPRAQQLSGKVHPRTGHTTGGISGIGHRNSASHMPTVRQPKSKRSIPGSGKAGGAIKKLIIGTPRDPRRR